MQNHTNDQLLELYQDKLSSYSLGIKELGGTLDYARPLLIKLKDETSYEEADKKIMILGQETNMWAGECETTESIMNKYTDFFRDGDVNYRGPFWNEAKHFIQLLKTKYPSRKISFTWNNVVKVGKASGKGFPGNTVYNIELNHFDVLKREIEILKPDMLLFLSGPNYDLRIKDKLGDFNKVKVKEYKERALCRLEFKDSNLPISFRTYHPGYMYMKKINKLEYFNSIIDHAFEK